MHERLHRRFDVDVAEKRGPLCAGLGQPCDRGRGVAEDRREHRQIIRSRFTLPVTLFELVKARLNPRLGIAGILITMVDGRTRLADGVEAEVRRHFGDLVFSTTVPRSVRLAEAPSHGLPAIAYDRGSRGAQAYWKVAMELVDRP